MGMPRKAAITGFAAMRASARVSRRQAVLEPCGGRSAASIHCDRALPRFVHGEAIATQRHAYRQAGSRTLSRENLIKVSPVALMLGPSASLRGGLVRSAARSVLQSPQNNDVGVRRRGKGSRFHARGYPIPYDLSTTSIWDYLVYFSVY